MNLTALEIMALDSPINVSDGHARQSLTPGQQAIVDQFPEMFSASLMAPFAELEREAQAMFLTTLGQHEAPVAAGRVLSLYSSSVGMDIVARCLAQELKSVALVHPTFDNIPDLLKGRDLTLLPVSERILDTDPERAFSDKPQAVFITTPNNPAGWVLSAPALERIGLWCARNGAILCLDTSFRGFDPVAQYDSYAILDATGAEYVVIEDTGKLWPMGELKLGFVCHSRNCRLPLREAVSDVLLTVSPFVLSVVQALAEDGAAGGLMNLRTLIQRNREILGAAIASTSARLPDGGCVSVARLALGERMSAESVWRALREINVDALPCGAFHWADWSEGDAFLRIALARDEEVVEQAAAAAAQIIDLMANSEDTTVGAGVER